MEAEGKIFQIIVKHYHSGKPGDFFKGTPTQFKAAAAEIAKAHESDLSTARDQLAETREQMIAIARLLREAQRILDSYGFANFSREVDKALSAAPAGGRVVLRKNVDLMYHHPSRETLMYASGPGDTECESGEYLGAIRAMLWDDPKVGVVVKGFIITMQETASSADEE